MLISKNGKSIESVTAWFEHAPPKGKQAQWQDGRSAKELAQAWFINGLPATPIEITQLLESHVATAGTILEAAEPEAHISFDKRGGEPRNADLAIRGSMHGQVIAVTVEAKADEPFAELVSDTLADAVDRWLSRGRGAGVARVRDLAAAFLPPCAKGLPALKEVRYQLLTGLAGTLAWATVLEATKAVWIVHEFQSEKTSREKLKRNSDDLNRFVTRLTAGKIQSLPTGALIGPLHVPGLPLFTQPAALYIGKAIRQLGPPKAT